MRVGSVCNVIQRSCHKHTDPYGTEYNGWMSDCQYAGVWMNTTSVAGTKNRWAVQGCSTVLRLPSNNGFLRNRHPQAVALVRSDCARSWKFQPTASRARSLVF